MTGTDLFIILVSALVGWMILYWIIRSAVEHAIKSILDTQTRKVADLAWEADKARGYRTDPPGRPNTPPSYEDWG